MSLWPTYRRRFRSALVMALAGAAVFSAWVSAMFVVSDGANVRRVGLTLPQLVGLYFGGAVVLSAYVALLHPLRRTLWGRLAMGALLGVPFGIAIAMYVHVQPSLRQWIAGIAIFAGLGAFFFGIFVEAPPDDDR